MEMELSNIIAKLKQEGVGEAEKEAARIKEKAEAEARAIVEEAMNKKKEIVSGAQQEARNLRTSGEEAVRQASRDALLGLRESVTDLFDRIMKKEVKEALTTETVKKMVLKLAENSGKDDTFSLEVLLNEQDRKELEGVLEKDLKKELGRDVTLKASPNVEKGFRIGEKGGNTYYDFSDEAIAEAFRAYLNPRVAGLLIPEGSKK
jgi:vacuolar-type H+-ATPase subunit E/Vma4